MASQSASARESPWIGLVGIGSGAQNVPVIGHSEGGFVWVAAMARDAVQFRKRVQDDFASQELRVLEITDVSNASELEGQSQGVDYGALVQAARESGAVVWDTTVYLFEEKA